MNEGRKNLLKGSMAESFAVNKLIQMGLSVSMPVYKQCKYDCILDYKNDLYRVQIKKITQHYRKSDKIQVSLKSGHYNSSGVMDTYKYTKNDIDAYIFVDLEKENCFWALFEETPSSSFTISYIKENGKYSNGGTPINYFEDYLLENRLDNGKELMEEEKSIADKQEDNDSEEIEGSVFDY
jgi:hypothetical protein